jgi:hypothetical protein
VSAASDEPPPDAVELLVMADLLGIVAAIEPIDVAPMVGASAPSMMVLLPIRWVPDTTALFEKLAGGRLVAWGRQGGLLGRWARLPSGERVWRSVEVDWGHSVLSLVGEHPVWTLTVGGEGFRRRETPGRVVMATLYDCRVAWATQTAETVSTGRRRLDDEALVAELAARVMTGEGKWAASGELAVRAGGSGTLETKRKRLLEKLGKLKPE